MTDNRLAESWSWFGLASFVVIWRFISRSILLRGWTRLMIEDYLMLLTFAFYTNLIVWINIQTKFPTTNILPETGLDGLSAADIQNRIYGSKITFVIEESMIMTQWGCKTCIVIMYYRLTNGLRAQKLVKLLMGYVALGWIVIEVFFFGIWCRPFMNYFVVKLDNSRQCETSGHHLIMSYVFNLSSDLLMLTIPLALFVRSSLPPKKKIALCSVFGLGIFVIIAATLNRYYSFAHPDSILWIFWYVREASTAVLVANIPNCYTLLRRLLKLGDFESIGSETTLRQTPNSKRKFDYFSQMSDLTKVSRMSGHDTKLAGNDSESMETFTKNSTEPKLQIWEHRDFVMEESGATPEKHSEFHESERSGIYGDEQGHLQSVAVGGTTRLP